MLLLTQHAACTLLRLCSLLMRAALVRLCAGDSTRLGVGVRDNVLG
jgi:hypothetical protein